MDTLVKNKSESEKAAASKAMDDVK